MAPTNTPPRPLAFSGPSGVGKSTLIKRLFQKHPDRFGFSVSHTTRKPRAGEENGREYHFVTVPEFEALVRDGGFVEHAKFGGNYYGTSFAAVDAVAKGEGKAIDGSPATGEGRVCILDIEMEGVKQLKKSDLKPRICFIQPESPEVLEQRLRGRGTDDEESIQKRLTQAKNEIEYCKREGKDDKVIYNIDLETAFKELDEWAMAGLS